MTDPLRALALLGIGTIINVWALRTSNSYVIVWHVFPYALACGLYVLLRNAPILTGILFMLVADIWLYTEVFLGTKSRLLMAVSLLSTLKIVLLFPLGIAVSGLVRKIRARKNRKPEGQI